MEKYLVTDISLVTDPADHKRFELVKKLSKDFTEENAYARKIDQILADRYLIQGNQEPTGEPKVVKKPEKVTKQQKVAKSNQVSTAEQLFAAIIKHQNVNTSGVSEQQLLSTVNNALKSLKIDERNLSESLAKKISVVPQTIQYHLPTVKLAPFQKPPIGSFQSIVDDVVMGNNVLLVGGAGTGKTYLAEQLISKLALNREYVTINCSQWTSPTEIIGGQTMDGYVEGKLIEAWSKGLVLILDELPKIDPNTAGLLNDALAKTKTKESAIFNSRKEKFTKHDQFACIATGNIYPDKESLTYGANNKQDLSLLDRFSGSVYFIEKNPEIERKIIDNDMIWSLSDALRSAIEELKYEAQLSLRFMQNARDSYVLEMDRINKNIPLANEGKTLKGAFDSYLSVFTPIQRQNLYAKIKYSDLLYDYQYRILPTRRMVLGRS